MCSVLHHVEFCVGEEKPLLNLLIGSLGFRLLARHVTPRSSKWALKHGTSVFVVTKRTKNHDHQNTEGILSPHTPLITDHCKSKEDWTVFCCQDQPSHVIDSLFNVALIVKDVDNVTQRVKERGGQVLREPADVKDSHGQVRYSIVATCFSNVVHTLINKQHYSGEFLPKFERFDHGEYESKSTNPLNKDVDEGYSNEESSYAKASAEEVEFLQEARTKYNNFWRTLGVSDDCPLFTYVDHVALACEIGQSKELMAWYEHCFGMKRFIINRKEDEREGFVLEERIGMRIKAMEYWKCAETGLIAPTNNERDPTFKMVVVEPLEGYPDNNVSTFLLNHKGSGIQHLALHTPDMTPAVKHVSQKGISFRIPPPAYYQKDIRLEDIIAAGHGHELDLFQKLGILVDIEEDDDVLIDVKQQQGEKKYLLQVFTTPIFKEDTFFIELIHRIGAKGFGAGNIRALAQSIHYDQKQKEAAAAAAAL